MTWALLIAAYGAAALVGARGWLQAGRLIRHWGCSQAAVCETAAC